MRGFVMTMFVLHMLGVTVHLLHLVRKNYPRVVTWRPWEEALGLVFSAAFAVWCAWMLWA